MFSRRALAPLVLTTVLLSSCSPSPSMGPAPESVAGSYRLVLVDGAEPPNAFADLPGMRMAVVGGMLELGRDGAFTETLTFEITLRGDSRVAPTTNRGRYGATEEGALRLVSGGTDTEMPRSRYDPARVEDERLIYRVRLPDLPPIELVFERLDG